MYERREELEAIDQALRRAAGGSGSALLVEGPAGMGKSTLLAEARAAGERAGLTVLHVRGTRLEQGHPFGGARRLLGRVRESLGERAFSGPAAAARAVLDDVFAVDGGSQPPPAAPLLGLVAVVGALADEEGSLLLSVDDAHWLDGATLDLLTMLAGRLDGLPLVIAAAARTGAEELRPALARLAAEPEVQRLPLAPLGAGGVESVLTERLGSAATPELVGATLEATGGNPWFVAALAGELARDPGRAPVPAQVRALAPHAIAGAVEARVAAVEDGPAVARALVTLGEEAERRHVATLAELPLDRAAAALDSLAQAGVLVGNPPRFPHAILREAVESSVPPGRRAIDHGRAARMLAQAGEPDERVALHLLESEPAAEEWAVHALLEAAARARSRGAPRRAAILLERALAEPPSPGFRSEVEARLGTALLEAGDAAGAVARLSSAVAPGRDAPVETLRRLAQAHASAGQIDEAVETLERALDERRLTPEERAVLTADVVALGAAEAGMYGRVRLRLDEVGPVDESTPAGRLALAARARDMTVQGIDADATAALAERALARGALAAESSVWVAWAYAVYALIAADRNADAIREIDRTMEEVVSRASVGWYCTALMLRADAGLRAGDIAGAYADAAGSVEAAVDNDFGPLPTSIAMLAAAHLGRDDLDSAEQVLGAHGFAGELPEHILFWPVLYVRGRLHLMRGRVEQALADLLDLGRREDEWASGNPGGYPWRLPAIDCLRRLERQAEAYELASEQAALAERWSTPRTRCFGEFARGLVADDRLRAEEHFEAAVAAAGSASPVPRITALIELGRSIRQRGERARAREPLREALTEAHARGAVRLARVAEEELRAARGRPPKRTHADDDELTPSERRIATLAAAGASNREIAASLFLSVRTVETHLTSAYRRLSISSRRELADALARQESEPAQAAGA